MKEKLTFFTLTLLSFVVFFGLIRYIFNMHSYIFVLEFLVLMALLILAIISLILIYTNIYVGYLMFAVINVLAFINLLTIYLRKESSTLLYMSLISALTAFVLSVVQIGRKKRKSKVAKKPVVTTYTPGKVIASKTSSYYHIPKCDWAKKISKGNEIWYESDAEAKKAGLKAHNCAK